jgi:excisionase family DNA binding protein
MVDNSELLTVADVARYLGISKHTVYRWIASGRLPALRLSRKVIRVRRLDLDALNRQPVAVGEPRAEYAVSDGDAPSARARSEKEFGRVIERYRRFIAELEARPRGADEPPRGSPEAILRHVGSVSKETGDELYRLIIEDREGSIGIEDPDPLVNE